MLKRSRVEVHARLAKALTEKFPEVVAERPELAAYHLAAAEQKKEAIGYAQKAAMGALMRSANAEAVMHARGALDWSSAIEAPEERNLTELGLNGLLTMGLMAQKGYASPDVAGALGRSEALLAVLGDGPHTVQTLWALFMYRHLRCHRQAARKLAERLHALALRTEDAGLEVVASPLLSQALLAEGRFAEARGPVEKALTLYDPAAHAAHTLMYGLDSRVYASATLSNLLWILGYAEQSLRAARSAVLWARESNHKHSYLWALLYQAIFHTWQGEREEAWKNMQEVLEASDRYGLAMYRAFGSIWRGWASRDVEIARQGLAEVLASGQEAGLPMVNALVADVEIDAGLREEAFSRIDRCLKMTAETLENYYDAPLLRLKAAAVGDRDPTAAEAYLRRAVEVARAQSARAFELQVSTDLAHLLHRRGDVDGARAVLRPIYDWFTEGLDGPMLGEASRVLAALE
jgi:ATP/maltotriose-dependent transcriptional regulator MalT